MLISTLNLLPADALTSGDWEYNVENGAAKYYIYRKGPGETSFTKLVQTSSLSYINRSAAAGKTYRYSIRTVASDGTMSAYSTGKSITYTKP